MTEQIGGLLKSAVLVVDDNPVNVELMEMLLSAAGFDNVVGQTEPTKVMDDCRRLGPDLLILDLRMPVMDGFQVMAQLRADPQFENLPILVVTADVDRETRLRVLSEGGSDYLPKPFDQRELLARVNNLLKGRLLLVERAQRAAELERKVKERTQELRKTVNYVVEALGRAGEYRDNETGFHVRRMSEFSYILAVAAGMDESDAELLKQAATMHDVGKIGIPDYVLLKPGRLDDDELAIMRKHPAIGAEILAGHSAPMLQLAEVIALTHHEKWDGSGYPVGLFGEQIPLPGRIIAIADVFDALTSTRPYKKPWTVDDAYALLIEQSGKHFDPDLVDKFVNLRPQVEAIKEQFVDRD